MLSSPSGLGETDRLPGDAFTPPCAEFVVAIAGSAYKELFAGSCERVSCVLGLPISGFSRSMPMSFSVTYRSNLSSAPSILTRLVFSPALEPYVAGLAMLKAKLLFLDKFSFATPFIDLIGNSNESIKCAPSVDPFRDFLETLFWGLSAKASLAPS